MEIKFYRIIVIILFLASVQYGKTQPCDTMPLMKQQITASAVKLYYVQYDDSPYLYNDWRTANITLNGGEIYHNVKVKIDLFIEELVYYNGAMNQQLIIDKEIIDRVDFIDDFNFTEIALVNVCNNDSNKNSQCDFYFVHLQDSLSLWSRQHKKVENYNEPNGGNSKLGSYYLRKKHYYMQDGDLKPIPLTKRTLSKDFPHMRKPLMSFIRKGRYSVKKSKDLIEIFKFINQYDVKD